MKKKLMGWTSDSKNLKIPSKLHDMLVHTSRSSLDGYQKIVIGRQDLSSLIKYEVITSLFGSLSGALGFLTRKLLFKYIIGEIGQGVIFGKNITIRHGHKIHIGNRVVIDDNVVLDAKGGANQGVFIGDNTIISRNCILSCKGGSIRVGKNVSLGINSLIHSIHGSNVRVGNNVVVAAFTYLIGGGNYNVERLDMPIQQQGIYSKGGVTIGNNVWLGSHVQVLDGVSVGRDSIIAAGAVVHHDVPDFTVAGGVPARILKTRQ